MSYGEALRMVSVLAGDPSSQVATALGGWAHPISRADMTLRDLFDLQHTSKAKRKPRPYPRPWDAQPVRTGAGTSMTVADFKALKASITKDLIPLRRDPRGRLRDQRGRFVAE